MDVSSNMSNILLVGYGISGVSVFNFLKSKGNNVLVYDDYKFQKIGRRMKKFIPKNLYEELFKEQSVRAYFNLPISEKYISLIIYAGSIEDDYLITNSVLYLVNYDIDGNIIDYIKELADTKIPNLIKESSMIQDQDIYDYQKQFL